MTPLLEAAVAAREVGLSVPECPDCKGHGEFAGLDGEGWYQCGNCHATGIDPDPARLGWVAYLFLTGQEGFSSGAKHTYWHPEWHPHWKDTFAEFHDGTETGIATALLRLVARAGGKQ